MAVPAERGGTVGRRRERLAAQGVADDADDGLAVLDEGERDAEERDRVGVVDRAVERIADPRAVGGGRRPPRLLAEEARRPGSARRGRPGSCVSAASSTSVTMSRIPLNAISPASSSRSARRSPARSTISIAAASSAAQAPCAGHRVQLAASGRSAVPSAVTRCSNVSDSPAAISGDRTKVSTGGLPR